MMDPSDDEMGARAQAQYERTAELVRSMPEVFHDLWSFAENRAAVKTADGTVYGIAEMTEATRDAFGQIWVTFTLLNAEEADLVSFEQLAGAAGTVVSRVRPLGSITLRYDQIAALLVDEDEPEEDEEED